MGLDGAEETSDIEEPSGYFKIRNGKRKSDKRVTDIDIVDEQVSAPSPWRTWACWLDSGSSSHGSLWPSVSLW